MGLSLRKLLYSYFTVDELKEALDDIGELLSGSKDQLVARIVAVWESHNRDIYDLLDFMEKDMLRLLCEDYNLESDGDFVTLKRRIRKAQLIQTKIAKSPVEENKSGEIQQDNSGRKTIEKATEAKKIRYIKVIGIIAAVLIASTTIFTNITEILNFIEERFNPPIENPLTPTDKINEQLLASF